MLIYAGWYQSQFEISLAAVRLPFKKEPEKSPSLSFKDPWKNPSKEHSERSSSWRSAFRAGSSCSYSLPGAAGMLTNGGKNVIWFAGRLPISAAVMLNPRP